MVDLNIVYNTEQGKIIKARLKQVVESLDKISDLGIEETSTVEKIAVNVIARLESIKILKKELDLAAPDGEKSELSIEEKKKKYGLDN